MSILELAALAAFGLFFISQGFRLYQNRKGSRYALRYALVCWNFGLWLVLPLLFWAVGLVKHG